jgi:hypothetical protein
MRRSSCGIGGCCGRGAAECGSGAAGGRTGPRDLEGQGLYSALGPDTRYGLLDAPPVVQQHAAVPLRVVRIR